jgi:hypothetical protein
LCSIRLFDYNKVPLVYFEFLLWFYLNLHQISLFMYTMFVFLFIYQWVSRLLGRVGFLTFVPKWNNNHSHHDLHSMRQLGSTRSSAIQMLQFILTSVQSWWTPLPKSFHLLNTNFLLSAHGFGSPNVKASQSVKFQIISHFITSSIVLTRLVSQLVELPHNSKSLILTSKFDSKKLIIFVGITK